MYNYRYHCDEYPVQSGRTIPAESGRRAQSELAVGHGSATERDRIVSGNDFVVSHVTGTQQCAEHHRARTVQSTVGGPSRSTGGHHMFGHVRLRTRGDRLGNNNNIWHARSYSYNIYVIYVRITYGIL